jgi:hypothetical protein
MPGAGTALTVRRLALPMAKSQYNPLFNPNCIDKDID